MKNKILILITLIIMILSVGCTNNTKEDTNQSVEQNEITERSIDEMYEIYDKYMPNFKLLSESNGIVLEDISEKQMNYKDKITGLYHYDESNAQEGDIIGAKYIFSIEDDGSIKYIQAVLNMKITEEGFKVEESQFNELREIFTDEKIDYTEINEEINESIRDGVDNNIINQYDDIEEDILIGGGTISYRLRIYP